MVFRSFFAACAATICIPAALLAAEPQWIWSSGKPAAKELFFRKVIDVAEPKAGTLEITCDNYYELFVNGKRLGDGKNWQQLDTYNIGPILQSGKNVIAVHGTNGDDIGGLAIRGEITTGSEKLPIASDASWKVSPIGRRGWRELNYDDASWTDAALLGVFNKEGPWGAGVGKGKRYDTPVAAAKRGPASKFELKDGDRIALLGGTFVERDWTYSYLETALTARNPDKHLVFRNLGWSGDTVWGDARAGFGGRADGFNQLKARVAEVKPTVIFVFYGTNESFAGPDALDDFAAGLNQLLDALTVTGARVVLFSPLKHENLGPPLPDPTAANKNLDIYGKEIGEVAYERGCNFVDLYAASDKLLASANAGEKLTNNGMHLNQQGAARIATSLADELQPPQASSVVLDSARLEKLRQTIVAKNQLFFHRWRPQNETYIFGFRKGEQGRNAVEIPQFDPLIEKAEAEIHQLAQPAR